MFDFSLDANINKKEVVLKSNYDLLVIGGGPGAVNASIYAARNNLKVLMVAKEFGGQLLNTNEIDNYLGYFSVSGETLSNKFLEHLKKFDVDLVIGKSVSNIIKNDERDFSVKLNTLEEVNVKSVIVATGGNPRKLNVLGEEKLTGRGVSYCVICDGAFYKNKDVVVVGGGNSALEAALDLSLIANNVHMVQNMDHFTGDSVLVDRVLNTKNITYDLSSSVVEIIGDNNIDSIKILKDGTLKVINTGGVFVEIGIIPNSSLVKDLVKLNNVGEIITDNLQNTSVSGIYAVGDVTNFLYKQVITAASQGAVAALSANKYIKEGE